MTLLLCATAATVGGALVFAAYLVSLRRTALNAFLRLEAELDRRYNLGLKLLRATQAHLAHDDAVMTAFVDARGLATQTALDAFLRPECPELVVDLAKADEADGRALSAYADYLRVYPMAQQPEVTKLLHTLAATPERVRDAEVAYNRAADAYNGMRPSALRRLTFENLPAHLPLFSFRPTPLRVMSPVAVPVAA